MKVLPALDGALGDLCASLWPENTVVVLHIGATQTTLVAGAGSESQATRVLAIGAQRTAAEHFKHVPPTPPEMENAIIAVEDEVARSGARFADGSLLLTDDAALREIARLSGVTQVTGIGDRAVLRLPLATVEATFDRLSAVVLGRPASSEGLPTGSDFAATLLILRELMHHLNFAAISIATIER